VLESKGYQLERKGASMCETCQKVGAVPQYKVGDRVEVLAPAEGVGDWDKNNIGHGTVERTSTDKSGSVQIKVDTNDYAWWYQLENVRLLRPINEPTETTPSITVGTQVRLTGVVTGRLNEEEEVVWVTANDFSCPIPVGALEVIRQPFRRGEVVWSVGAVNTGEQYVVFNDEFEGRIDVVHCPTGTATTNNDASLFERRP
jgi:hypothetical protein